jgi:hypothetical protein
MLISEVIKLRDKGPSDRITKFMEEFYSITQANPFNDRERVLGKARIELSPFAGEIHISDIVTMAPKTGAATEAMKTLIALANKHKVVLHLTAKAYTKDKQYVTKTEDLVRWYAKLGFEPENDSVDLNDLEGWDDVDMKYYPK